MYTISRKKVLLVEDETAIRQVLCFFLTHADFDVLGVASGEEAMRVIPEFQPDLLILDIMMRPVSGWDVLRWLQARYQRPLLPVLVLTARVQLAEQLLGYEAGAVEYLTKPTQPSIIVEHVRTLLSLSTEQQTMLRHKRIDEQRKMLERLRAPLADEFVY